MPELLIDSGKKLPMEQVKQKYLFGFLYCQFKKPDTKPLQPAKLPTTFLLIYVFIY